MDVILAATGDGARHVRQLEGGVQPRPADPALIAKPQGRAGRAAAMPRSRTCCTRRSALRRLPAAVPAGGPDWDKLFNAVTGAAGTAAAAVSPR